MKQFRALIVATVAVVTAGVTVYGNNQAAFSPALYAVATSNATYDVTITSPVIGCDPIKQKGITVGEDCHWPITVDVNVQVVDGNYDPAAADYVSVSPSQLTFYGNGDQQTVTVTVAVPGGALIGDYQYQLKTHKAVPSGPLPVGGYGHGPGSILYLSVPDPTPAPVDDTPPVVTISAPLAGAQLTYCTAGTPLSIAFAGLEAGEAGSVVSGMAADVNGFPVSLLTSGLGTTSASATANGTLLAGIGTFTITASATNSFALTGTASADVTVAYTLGWLPPLALGKTGNGGSTVPIKFTVRDCNSAFVHDESVTVVVYETSAIEQPERLRGVYGEGASSVRIDDVSGQYIINFPTTKGAKTYRVDVYFGGWANGQTNQYLKQGSTTFSTR